MSPYSNSFQLATRDANPIAFSRPKPHLFPALQNRQNNAPAQSGPNILDVTEVWRENLRRNAQSLDEQIDGFSQLKLSKPVSPSQPSLSFAQPGPESALGQDKKWPWMGETPNLSSSPVSDISGGSTARGAQSPDRFSSVGSQTWPSFPSWDMSVAAAHNFSLANETPAFRAPRERLSLDSLNGSAFASTSGDRQYQPQTHDSLLKQHGGFDFSTQAPSNPPRQKSTFVSTTRTNFEPSTPALSMARAPIGNGAVSKAVSVNNASNLPPASLDFLSITHPRSPPQEWQYGQGGQASSSISPSSPSATRLEVGARNMAHGKKSGPAEPAPSNRKSVLYKTEMCRNWEEKGHCFYEQ
ncbi:hypothetical protein [Sporisorium scitamineum]|uniref:C3H1-type domain-containing protein n=1 Tax=Sporisorium scitamineum TaxID=49012 RepID=A0A0F7SB00_9BASI|nr:hypothetical protein [Sporisorium scitamineum]